MLILATTPANSPGGSAAAEAGKMIGEQGRLFGSAGIDGLILWAMLIGSLLLFAGLMVTLWLQSKERARAEAVLTAQADRHAKQVEGFTAAALATAEAVKDLSTAVTSAASADMTFKQAMGAHLIDCKGRLDRLERSE